MIKLKEILHTVHAENKEGLSIVDDWKITDADHMYDMGFKADGMYHFALKNPEITVAHKKNEGFVLTDKKKNERKVFPKFEQLIEYFSNYQQQWDHTAYL